MKVWGYILDGAAGGWYRFIEPVQWLVDHGYVESAQGEIYVVYCPRDNRDYSRSVIDLDDNNWDLPQHLLKHPGVLLNQAILPKALDQCVAVTCANERLAEETRKRTDKPVFFCRTGIDPERILLQDREPEKPLIAWRGTEGWLRGLVAIQPVLQKFGEKVLLWGDLPDLGVPMRSRLSWYEYLPALNDFRRTVEIFPSFDAPFEACKSPIKLYQAMAAGVPCIAAALPPYESEVEDNVTGLLYHDNEELDELLTWVLKDKPLRQRLGAAGREWVLEERHISKTAMTFYDAWSKICALA